MPETSYEPELARARSQPGSALDFRLLGQVEAECEGRALPLGRPQERLLLGVLLLEAGRPLPVDRLADLLWPERPPRAPRQAIQTYVCRLRAALAPACGHRAVELLARCGDSYLADVSPGTVDAHRFVRMVVDAQRTEDPVERSSRLSAALSLWRGPLLAGLAPERLRRRIGGRIEALREYALRARIDADLAVGRHAELVGELTERLADSPLDDVLAGYLMLALHRSGRRTDALAVYRNTRARIASELGLDPGPQIEEIHRAVLRTERAPRLSTKLAAQL